MSAISRRALICGAAGIAAAAFLFQGKSLREWCLYLIEGNFGSHYAKHQATHDFVDAFLESSETFDGYSRYSQILITLQGPEPSSEMLDEMIEFWSQLLMSYLTSTTIIASIEFGEPLNFIAVYDPYNAPCGNALTAFHFEVSDVHLADS